jgi:L-rhamnose-H+ transport protein
MKTLSILLVAVLAGIFNGSYAVPMKMAKNWNWENTWLWFAIFGLLIIPWAYTIVFIPHYRDILLDTSTATFLKIFLFGMGWGIGSVAFGLALVLIGFSLGYTIMMGLIAIIGALVPLIVNNHSAMFSYGGKFILFALVMSVAGIFFCSKAGKSRGNNINSEHVRFNFKKGLLVSFIAGTFSSMLNFAFDTGKNAFQHTGMPASQFNVIIWTIALTGGCIPFVVYCAYLLNKNASWKNFAIVGKLRNFSLSLLMGLLFFCSVMFYGWAASTLGSIGSTIGWIIFMAGAILTANFWGLLSGEWNSASKQAKTYMLFGSVLLIFTIFLASYGNSRF